MNIGVDKNFATIIECLFLTSGLNMDYFRRVAKSSNEYGRSHLKSGKFGVI